MHYKYNIYKTYIHSMKGKFLIKTMSYPIYFIRHPSDFNTDIHIKRNYYFFFFNIKRHDGCREKFKNNYFPQIDKILSLY